MSRPASHDDMHETAVPGLAALARERAPGHDLWPGIAARLTPRAVRRAKKPVWHYALAASICLTVPTGLLLRHAPAIEPAAAPSGSSQTAAAVEAGGNARRPYGNSDGEATKTAALSPRTLRMLRSESLDNAPALVAQRADGVSGLMKATYAAQGGRHAQGQQAILRANLKLVAQAEREVRRALKADPDSASLQALLEVAEDKRAALTALLVHEPD